MPYLLCPMCLFAAESFCGHHLPPSGSLCGAPTRLLYPFQFLFQILAFVEGQPASQSPRFSRRTIRELGIGMQTRHRWIGPDAVAGLPGRDDPALAVLRAAGHIRFLKN